MNLDLGVGAFITTIALTEPPTGQRVGQWLFNELHAVKPELANRVRRTAADPFYCDERIKDFWQYVYDHWSDT